MSEFILVKAYKDDEKLRHSFNELAKKNFGLDFEDWYQNGYWKEGYIPYSVIDNGKVVSNVSVSIMDFVYKCEQKRLIQLGTIMTEEKYRNLGLIRTLMAEIEKDYGGVADGFFLFANDNVLDFYPKFGYRTVKEYQYSKEVNIHGEQKAVQIPMKTKEDWSRLENAIYSGTWNGKFEMLKNPGMVLFYVTKFMQENVYYIKEQDTYVIAEFEENDLFIHTIISRNLLDIDEVIKAFGNVERVTLGFTPVEKRVDENEEYTISLVCEEDTTLFAKGMFFENFDEKKVMFPTLSHA